MSYVDVLSIHNMDKKTLSISNIEILSILNIDINVLYIAHVDKLSIPYRLSVFGYVQN